MTSTDINPQKSDKPFVINNIKENTMKIKVIISIMLLIGTMMISGCVSSSSNNEIEYVAYEAGGFDSLDGGSHLSEIPIWKDEKINFHQDSSAPKEAEVTFNGTHIQAFICIHACVDPICIYHIVSQAKTSLLKSMPQPANCVTFVYRLIFLLM